jgi:hypothetical protein
MGNFAQASLNGPPEKMDASYSRCGGAMNLIRIEPAWRHYERRILECRECGQSESYTK